MMGILEFTLPDEQEDFDAAVNGMEYLGVIHAMDEELRKILKYEPSPQISEEKIRDLRRFLRESAPKAFLDR